MSHSNNPPTKRPATPSDTIEDQQSQRLKIDSGSEGLDNDKVVDDSESSEPDLDEMAVARAFRTFMKKASERYKGNLVAVMENELNQHKRSTAQRKCRACVLYI